MTSNYAARLVSALLMAAIFGSTASAVLVFDLADTTDAQFEHDSNGTNFPLPIPSAGSAAVSTGTFSWGNLLTDTTPNVAEFTAGQFESGDWGGNGTFTSSPIDVSLALEMTIEGVFSGTFNTAPTEFSEFFYQLDGGTPVSFGQGDGSDTATPVSATGVDVSGVSALVVGFDFNHNGGSDFFDVASLTVNVVAVPEPTAALFGSLLAGGLGMTVARRSQHQV